jgi:aspartyl protease family protein
MLRNAIIMGLFLVGASVSVPLLYRAYPQGAGAPVAGSPASLQPATAVAPARTPSGRRFRIDVDASGHYVGDFKLNGRKVAALIDTGASAVAINLSTARRLGMNVRPADLTNSVNTANGKARATLAMIDRIEIGRISIENVQAVVLEDQALGTTLIGMTFLNRLKAFQVDAGTLTLVQ